MYAYVLLRSIFRQATTPSGEALGDLRMDGTDMELRGELSRLLPEPSDSKSYLGRLFERIELVW